MSSNGGPTVSVKLFIDKEKNRVLFAESDKDFVDVLFSFLTLPLGTIVRLLGNNSQVGCIDEVYKSVENLSEDHLRTRDCRAMLLWSVNSAGIYCDGLKIKVDDSKQRGLYTCAHEGCLKFSSVYGSACCVYGSRTEIWGYPVGASVSVGGNGDGVFVKSGPKFIITDDLQVTPVSTGLVFSLLGRLRLHDQVKFEERVLALNSNQIISLLKNALMSKQPLTGLCFDVDFSLDAIYDQLPMELSLKKTNETVATFSAIKIRLVHTEDSSTVLYAEVGSNFLDMIFGLLCVPLGSVIKAYGQWSPNGCIDGIYMSIDGSARACVKQECRSLLLASFFEQLTSNLSLAGKSSSGPASRASGLKLKLLLEKLQPKKKWPRASKLPPYFACSINVLQVEETPPRSVSFTCTSCRIMDIRCGCDVPSGRTVYETNPKSPSSGSRNTGEAYVEGWLRSFLVTSDLRVLEFSLTNTLQVTRAAKIWEEKLVEKELTLDKTQAVKLLRAAMLSRDAPGSLLSPPKK